jgi:dipeptidyl aminopeptidase/acylaminoacyl peptidase
LTKSLASLLLCASATVAAGQSRSPATIDDLLNQVGEPGQVAVSPDSAWVAVTIDRPATAGERYRDLGSSDRTDVWLFSSDARVRRNLTQGHGDASGWWEPIWSPDGRRLAMLSTRGTDGNVRLYVWDRHRDRIELATPRGVSVRLALQLPTYQRLGYCSWLHGNFAHYRWLNDTALVFLAFPTGTTAEWHELTEARREAERAWALQERGTAPTASVLDVGPGSPTISFPPLELTRVDVGSHTLTTLATVPMQDYRAGPGSNLFPAVGAVSPDGRTLALTATVTTAEYLASANSDKVYVPGLRMAFVSLGMPKPTKWLTIDSTGFSGTDSRTGDLGTDVTNCGPPRPVWALDSRSVLVHVLRDVEADDRWLRVSATGEAHPEPADAPPVVASDSIHPRLMLEVQKSQGSYDRFDLVLHGRDTVMTLNASGSRIDPGRKITFPYRGLDGDSLIAVLELPVGYVAGRHYPMVTVVYNSSMQRADDTVPNIEDALWAGHGYMVLYPSMPVASGPTDVLVDLPKGVVPAIDRAIALGYADPNRLGLKGHSYGGYSTYGLIAFSNRFKAAIAEAGPTDLTSLALTFYAGSRYRDSMSVPPSGVPGQLQTGRPPWENPARYVKNSPLTYVDRIRTPLMIVQGDFDYVPIVQGEEMFSALYGLGRRVQFVRYWGEGHWLISPANIRDKWQREFAWFDEFLKAP